MPLHLSKPLVLIGAGQHGRVIAEIAEALHWAIKGFFDADPGKKQVWDYPVRQQMEAYGPLADFNWILAIGNNALRKKIAAPFELNYATAIHPSAVISPRTVIGEGTVAMAGVCVNTGTVTGRHCILNTSCSIDHDCILEDYVHLSPCVALAGNVKVGEGTHVGIGASVIPGITIGKWCTIGAGAVVVRDVPDGVKVMGVPARIV